MALAPVYPVGSATPWDTLCRDRSTWPVAKSKFWNIVSLNRRFLGTAYLFRSQLSMLSPDSPEGEALNRTSSVGIRLWAVFKGFGP